MPSSAMGFKSSMGNSPVSSMASIAPPANLSAYAAAGKVPGDRSWGVRVNRWIVAHKGTEYVSLSNLTNVRATYVLDGQPATREAVASVVEKIRRAIAAKETAALKSTLAELDHLTEPLAAALVESLLAS